MQRIPVMERNKATEVYQVEKEIEKLLSKGASAEEIVRTVKILKKYNYTAYVQKNVKALSKNPKKYHQCLQNIIQWNVELGNQNTIRNQNDLDPSQVYTGKQGGTVYGKEAKR